MSRHQPVSALERSLFHRKGSAGALMDVGTLSVSPDLAAARAFSDALQRQVQAPTGVLASAADVRPALAYWVFNPTGLGSGPLHPTLAKNTIKVNKGWAVLSDFDLARAESPDGFYVYYKLPDPERWARVLVVYAAEKGTGMGDPGVELLNTGPWTDPSGIT